jgi:hypothetical protein
MKHQIVHALRKYGLNPPIKLLFALGIVPPGCALLEKSVGDCTNGSCMSCSCKIRRRRTFSSRRRCTSEGRSKSTTKLDQRIISQVAGVPVCPNEARKQSTHHVFLGIVSSSSQWVYLTPGCISVNSRVFRRHLGYAKEASFFPLRV